MYWVSERMTLAGDLLHQVRIDKGYGHSRAAFVAYFCIRWGQYTQRFLEVGRTLMREDPHLSHLIEVGLVKGDSPLHRQFRAAIERDRSQRYRKTQLADEASSIRFSPVWTCHGDETEEEMLVREVFEALQIDGFFNPPSMDLLRSMMRLSPSTRAEILQPNQPYTGDPQMKQKLADTALAVSASYLSR